MESEDLLTLWRWEYSLSDKLLFKLCKITKIIVSLIISNHLDETISLLKEGWANLNETERRKVISNFQLFNIISGFIGYFEEYNKEDQRLQNLRSEPLNRSTSQLWFKG